MTDPRHAAVAPVLPSPLQEAISNYNRWADRHLLSAQESSRIGTPLYHYTDGRGLKGILESQAIWFTDYRHLNDPSELIHGISAAHDAIRSAANGVDGRVRLFLECLIDMFSSENFSETLEFLVASFSRARDDLGQWRTYADNGRGYAIGFAPGIFGIEDKADRKPHENVFVGPVLYSENDVAARNRLAVDAAASIFLDAVNTNADLVRDKAIGIPFMQELVRAIIASPLIWNGLTSKHPAYAHEQEVRLIVLGLRDRLKPYIATRLQGSEIVPYIVHQLPMRGPQDISEIVVGPSAPAAAERSVRTMLDSLGIDPSVQISRSTIPYRAL